MTRLGLIEPQEEILQTAPPGVNAATCANAFPTAVDYSPKAKVVRFCEAR